MLLNFDIDKAIAATAYIIERDGGRSDMFPLIKKIYLADRSALIKWGKSITGDSFAALEKGPIVSNIYNLMKQEGEESEQIQWDNVIQKKKPYWIVLRKCAESGVLSEQEKEVLEEARNTINAIRGSIPKWVHKNCPEWTDPGHSSTPIDPSTILRLANKSEEEIQRLEETNEELRFLSRLLATRD
ncbi:MAG: Panacea domain-containing protein [Candidatus Korobacteraceae bacterium]